MKKLVKSILTVTGCTAVVGVGTGGAVYSAITAKTVGIIEIDQPESTSIDGFFHVENNEAFKLTASMHPEIKDSTIGWKIQKDETEGYVHVDPVTGVVSYDKLPKNTNQASKLYRVTVRAFCNENPKTYRDIELTLNIKEHLFDFDTHFELHSGTCVRGILSSLDYQPDNLLKYDAIEVPSWITEFYNASLAFALENNDENEVKIALRFEKNSDLVQLGDGTFVGWTGMSELDLSNCTKLKQIGYDTFRQCNDLKIMRLPSTINSVGLESNRWRQGNTFSGVVLDDLHLGWTVDQFRSLSIYGNYALPEISTGGRIWLPKDVDIEEFKKVITGDESTSKKSGVPSSWSNQDIVWLHEGDAI